MSDQDLLVDTSFGPVLGFRDTHPVQQHSSANISATGQLAPVNKWLVSKVVPRPLHPAVGRYKLPELFASHACLRIGSLNFSPLPRLFCHWNRAFLTRKQLDSNVLPIPNLGPPRKNVSNLGEF